MVLNLMDVMNNIGYKLPFEGTLQFAEEEFCGNVYNFGEGVFVKGYVENIGGDVELLAQVTGKGKTVCARCFAPVEFDISYSVREHISGEENEGDVIVSKGYMLDLGDIVLSNFFSSAETKFLCRPDCKGICSICGADKNKTECDCAQPAVDIRLSALDDWKFE